MLSQDLIDLPVEVFGGFNPALAPTVVPPGASPLAQDCDFPEGAVTTRGGLFNIFGPGNGINPAAFAATINGLKTYLTPQIQHRLIVWDSQGNLYKESPDGTLTQIAQRPQGANTLYQSTTLFGREYQAFYAYADPLLGLDIPRQYDDTNWDRVSQVGPGLAPIAADSSYTINIASAAQVAASTITDLLSNGPSNTNIFITTPPTDPLIFGTGATITVAGTSHSAYDGTYLLLANYIGVMFPDLTSYDGTFLSTGGTVASSYSIIGTATPHGLAIGQSVTLAGTTAAAYDGTWIVVEVIDATHFVVYTTTTGSATQGAVGTMLAGGNVAAGLHQVTVAFITRQGYITMPAVPPSSWTAAGNKQVQVSQIPTGPFNIIARLLIFTPVITLPATTGTFYSLPNGNPFIGNSTMLVNDNTTTSVILNFTDAVLISGFNAQYLFTQLELGECANVNGYNSRMVWCGERNKLTNLINLTFDGGWNLGAGPSGSDIPLGWTSVIKGGNRISGPNGVDWGDAYVIIGDGVTATPGMITQPCNVDYLGVSRLSINTSYSARIRLSITSSVPAGNVVLEVYSPNIGSLGTFTIPINPALTPNGYTEFSGPLLAAQTSLPTDIILRYYLNGTPNLGTLIFADNIEIYPTLQPYNFSTARFSHAFNPESYDGTTGAVQIRPNDGQMLHASWSLRGNLYLFKDHYSCYVTDDGVNEPASWAVNEVSLTVGCCGPNAIDGNEEWFVTVERSGLYIWWGSDPVKITPEVQQDASNTGKITWNSINWSASQCIWVRIDKVNKQILVGAPIGNATLPNVVFMMDYKWLEGAADIASSPMVTYSAFTGKVLAHGRGRRWMIWNISASAMTFAERADGTTKPFYGNSIGNGKVYEQLPPQIQASDDGVAINSFYSTYYSPSHVEEQMVQLGAHQKLLGYLKWRATGVGILSIAIITTRRTTNLRGYILSLNPLGDGERGIEVAGERFSIQVGTNAVGSYFSLEQIIPSMKKHPTFVVRGLNV